MHACIHHHHQIFLIFCCELLFLSLLKKTGDHKGSRTKARNIENYAQEPEIQTNNQKNYKFEVEHTISQRVWCKTVADNEIITLTKGICENGSFLLLFLEDAVDNREGASLQLEPAEKKMMITLNLEATRRTPKKTALVALDELEMDQGARVERMVVHLSKQLEELKTGSEDKFDPTHLHPDFVLSQNQTLITRSKNSGTHVGGTTSTLYSSGCHFWLTQLVRSGASRSVCFVGVVDSFAVSTYPGTGVHAKGVGFYMYNGQVYRNNSSADAGVGGLVPPGSFVGVLLDMNKKVVSFSVNGIDTQQYNLESEKYCLMVNLHDRLESVKLLSEFCYHKQ